MTCKCRQSGFSATKSGECVTEFVTGEHIDLDRRLASFTYGYVFDVVSVQLVEPLQGGTYRWFVTYRRR